MTAARPLARLLPADLAQRLALAAALGFGEAQRAIDEATDEAVARGYARPRSSLSRQGEWASMRYSGPAKHAMPSGGRGR